MTKRLAPVTVHRLAKCLAEGNPSSFVLMSRNLNISGTTLGKYRRLIREAGHSLADFTKLSSRQMQETLERQSSGKTRPERYSVLMYVLPDIWHRVSSGKSNLLICWAAYRTRHPDGYGYSQFTAYFHSRSGPRASSHSPPKVVRC